MDQSTLTRHQHYMERCLRLAEVAGARGDFPVGSVIVKANQIIAEGIEGGKTHRDITFHAEIQATAQAVKQSEDPDLSACVLYTTHEPCIMCSYVIRHHKIPLVVTGLATGEIGGVSSAMPVLMDTSVERWGRPPEVIQGILQGECLKVQSRFS